MQTTKELACALITDAFNRLNERTEEDIVKIFKAAAALDDPKLSYNYERLSTLALTLRKDSQNAPVYNGIGNTLHYLGFHEEAFRCYDVTLEIDPTFDMAQTNIGTHHYKMGCHEKAIVSFRKALELNPKNLHAHFHLGKTLTATKQFEKAHEHLTTALELATPRRRGLLRRSTSKPGVAKLIRQALKDLQNTPE